MAIQVNTTEDVSSSGGYLDDPGDYHFVIVAGVEGCGTEPPAKFSCEVLAGSVEGQVGKHWDYKFWLPSLQSTEKQTEQKNTENSAFLVAVNLLHPMTLGKPVEFEPSDAVGMQFVAKLKRKMNLNPVTKKYDIATIFLEIAFANVFHVDDPRAAKIAKNVEALTLIDPLHRHSAEWFAFTAKKNSKKAAVADFDF